MADVLKMQFNNLNDFEKKLYDFKIIFAYHSGKIENNKITFHDTRDIFENGKVTGYTGDLKTLFEIENQKTCYEFLKPYILEKKDLDITFIQKVQYELSKGTYDEYRYNINKEKPGKFKRHGYVTGANEIGSNPEDVEKDLKELLNELNNTKINNYFTAGVYFHARFKQIHPFAEGNGRTGRTLMNYYFMIHDIAPVIIYSEDKQEYYEALEKFDTLDELKTLINFIKKEQLKTWDKKQSNNSKNINDFLTED